MFYSYTQSKLISESVKFLFYLFTDFFLFGPFELSFHFIITDRSSSYTKEDSSFKDDVAFNPYLMTVRVYEHHEWNTC